jgi:putative redox protein
VKGELSVSRTLEVLVDQIGPSTGRATARTHTVIIDRPLDKGGQDRGPLGGELLLVSLGGCFLSNLLAAISTRSADVSEVHVKVSAAIGGVPERVEAMTLHVTAKYSDTDLMRKLLSIAEHGCLVTNTLKNAMVIEIVLEKSSR